VSRVGASCETPVGTRPVAKTFGDPHFILLFGDLAR
jgi:hypothetical protein